MKFKLSIYCFTALILAVNKGHTEVVKVLLAQENIDVNIKGILN